MLGSKDQAYNIPDVAAYGFAPYPGDRKVIWQKGNITVVQRWYRPDAWDHDKVSWFYSVYIGSSLDTDDYTSKASALKAAKDLL